MFVYLITNPKGLAERIHPDYSLECVRVPEKVHTEGTLVTGRHRVVGQYGDTFIKLEFGGGWLFECKDGERKMTPVPDVHLGTSVWRVNNALGLGERTLPHHSTDYFCVPNRIHPDRSLVLGTCRVQHPVTLEWFVRLEHGGWVFVSREGKPKMIPLICIDADETSDPIVLHGLAQLTANDPLALVDTHLTTVLTHRIDSDRLDAIEARLESWHTRIREARSNLSRCRLCTNGRRAALCMPCRHLCVCAACARDIALCPACDTPVTDVLIVAPEKCGEH